jgi:hypothetical protein
MCLKVSLLHLQCGEKKSTLHCFAAFGACVGLTPALLPCYDFLQANLRRQAAGQGGKQTAVAPSSNNLTTKKPSEAPSIGDLSKEQQIQWYQAQTDKIYAEFKQVTPQGMLEPEHR